MEATSFEAYRDCSRLSLQVYHCLSKLSADDLPCLHSIYGPVQLARQLVVGRPEWVELFFETYDLAVQTDRDFDNYLKRFKDCLVPIQCLRWSRCGGPLLGLSEYQTF
jgi:hypothetical protein